MRLGFSLSIVIALLIVCPLSIGAVTPLSGDNASMGLIRSGRNYDRPVNPDRYLIRPGDVFGITFINANLSPLQLAVDPEGNIINSTLAIHGVSGKTLTQVRMILKEELTALYNADEVIISIGEPMKVAISVSGAVRYPGLHTAWSSQRVSEIIDSAGGLTWTGSQRSIILSGGPEDILVDLDRARFLGNVEANPCLYAGYSIYVPSKSTSCVQVVGELNFPREIELIPGDDLDLLLTLAGGLRASGDRAATMVIRNAEQLDADSVQLIPGDIIVVPPLIDATGSDGLIVFGAVNQPGRYAHTTGITLPELIETAGGFTTDAAWGHTVLFRQAKTDERGRLTKLRYPISCSTPDRKGMSDIALQPADSVFVPTAMGYVRVRGAVHNPGYYMFVEDEDALFYVSAAGGYLPSADKSLVEILNNISNVTETHPPRVMVQDSDEIVIRIREELQ
ncbi:MAG: SLBB domain-containing protein [candidate division Zixibacteria bacterium]|nr:SLBB domain-containing protein [candidate division Zixibacteria bacterium]